MIQIPVTELVEQLRRLRDAGQQPRVLDVREPWEVALASLALAEASCSLMAVFEARAVDSASWAASTSK